MLTFSQSLGCLFGLYWIVVVANPTVAQPTPDSAEVLAPPSIGQPTTTTGEQTKAQTTTTKTTTTTTMQESLGVAAAMKEKAATTTSSTGTAKRALLSRRAAAKTTERPGTVFDERSSNTTVLCSNKKAFETVEKAMECFISSCEGYHYDRALCEDLARAEFEQFGGDTDAEWTPDSFFCDSVDDLLLADKHHQPLDDTNIKKCMGDCGSDPAHRRRSVTPEPTRALPTPTPTQAICISQGSWNDRKCMKKCNKPTKCKKSKHKKICKKKCTSACVCSAR